MAKGKTRNLFVWIILGLLFVGLIGFGSTGLSGRIRTIGTVGELPLSINAYSNELRGQIDATSAQLQTRLSFPQAEAFGLTTRALQTVVTDRVLDNEMLQIGVSVGDDEVRTQVLATPAFRGADGAFDRVAYRSLLSDNGLTESEYEGTIRDATTRAILQSAVLSAIPEPTVYAQTLARFIEEKRGFTWASVATLDTPLAEPTDADLEAFYAANPDDFTSLETRALTYAWITPDMIQDQVTVDEADLRADYDARINEFMQPERRLVERLVYSSAEEAATAFAALEAGEKDFETLVADRGLDLTDVDMGDVSQAILGAAGDAVFVALPGDVVGPFDSDLGPAIFRMNAILAAQETTFEEALPELREERAAARARRIIEDQIDPINDLLAGGATVEVLSEQTDMQLGTLDWTTASADGIAAYAAFREAAQTQEVGAYPELIELEDGGLFALRIDEVRAPALQPLDDVHDAVVASWTREATKAALTAQAEALVAQIDAETEFTELGLSDAIAERDMSRRDFLNDTPPTFMATVFTMEPGAVEIIEDVDKVLIVRLDSVADPAEDDAVVAAQEAQLGVAASEGISRDVFTYFSQALQAQTDIQLNDAAINAVHAQFQ